jgi:hypothetical protein
LNPEDIAASRHKEIRHAHAQIEKVRAAHAKSQARLQELRAQIGPAERRDREALGQALVAGKADPASQAEKLRLEIEQEERRAEALLLASDSARAQVLKLVKDNRAAWRAQAMRELAKAKQRYDESISELQTAREGLSSEATFVAWLDSGAGAEAASDPLGGRIGHDAQGRPPMSFTRTLEELRADSESLAMHPASLGCPIPEPRLELAWGGRK